MKNDAVKGLILCGEEIRDFCEKIFESLPETEQDEIHNPVDIKEYLSKHWPFQHEAVYHPYKRFLVVKSYQDGFEDLMNYLPANFNMITHMALGFGRS